MKVLYDIKRFLVWHNIIKTNYYAHGFVYIADGKPTTEVTDQVKWLDEVVVRCYQKDGYKKCIDILNERHPEYSGFIYLF